MTDIKSIQNEIKGYINDQINNQVDILNPEWVTNGIMKSHSDIHGSDSDFAICGCRAFVRNEVRKIMNKHKNIDDDLPTQLTLEGFEHLQKYYAVEREKERCMVRIDLLSFDELKRKSAEYRAMGDACHKHADEIDHYAETLALALAREKKEMADALYKLSDDIDSYIEGTISK